MAGTYRIGPKRIADAFARIEGDLLESMMRNLERHHVDEVGSGYEWTQWQAAQIAELEQFTRSAGFRYGPEFDRLNAEIDSAIAEAYATGYADEEARLLKAAAQGAEIERQDGFLRMPKERVDALIGATRYDMMKAEYATLRKAEDIYRQTIFTAQLYATTGATTYAKAIDMATHDFIAMGVNGIRYKNGSWHGIEEYSRMAVRTATKRAALYAEGDARKGWGVHTIFVNYRADACPECMQWIGRVLIDDVYSGGTAEESKETGYPLLSDAMAQGLFHPNCRDTSSTYFEGISDLPERPTAAEKARGEAREAEEQRLDQAEDNAKKYSMLEKLSLDMDDKRHYGELADKWEGRAEQVAQALERPKRGQIENPLWHLGMSGEELDKYNEWALDQIMADTGYTRDEAARLQEAMIEYFGGDYNKFTRGEAAEMVETINRGLEKMPVFDGTLYRGMWFDDRPDRAAAFRAFRGLVPGDTIQMVNGSVSSWADNMKNARGFASTWDQSANSVILICDENRTAVGIQHISKFGSSEGEALAPGTARWEVVSVDVQRKPSKRPRRTDGSIVTIHVREV